MIPGFEQIIEARIKKAQEEGAFDDLPGTGKPLCFEDESHVPEDLRLAHKILKNADCLPPEIMLRKEIRTTADLLEGITDTAKKHKTLKKLNFLIMKLNAMRGGSVAFDVPQRYYADLVDRIEHSKP
ncbi:DUF1992 domain-containing protein [Desulfosarcina sp. OttesenSCG-928-B08]|nr:DUF1992 domain-containing protein [Desulfosarcina sp. OttesenSCG-928-B08]